MKIQLPNGEKLTLDESIPLEEKKALVRKLNDEHYPLIEKVSWNSNSVRFFLEGLSNYLVWHKEEEEKNKQDKEVLSVKKVEQMTGKRKANSVPFSSLSTVHKELLGLDGAEQ